MNTMKHHRTFKEGMEQPLYYWDSVIAPLGGTFHTDNLFPAWNGSLFIGNLGCANLVHLKLEREKVVGEERLLTDLQPKRKRIRDVRQSSDVEGRSLKRVPARR